MIALYLQILVQNHLLDLRVLNHISGAGSICGDAGDTACCGSAERFWQGCCRTGHLVCKGGGNSICGQCANQQKSNQLLMFHGSILSYRSRKWIFPFQWGFKVYALAVPTKSACLFAMALSQSSTEFIEPATNTGMLTAFLIASP